MKTPVDGFILCGGKATRLEGINGLMPKCLLRVDGMSVLGRLIYGLEQYLSRITVSFAGDVRIYKETLSAELSAAVMDKINFEYDPLQHGTAMAVKNHDVRPNHALAVINGDTLYSSFDDVIPATHDAGEIVFSCSFEVVDRAGAIIIDPVTNRMSIKKNRAGGEDGQDWVTNGTLVIGSDVFSYLQGLLVNRGDSLENLLISMQGHNNINARVYQSEAHFIDIGVPDVFLDATRLFKALTRQGQ